jgi:hypothetical protein
MAKSFHRMHVLAALPLTIAVVLVSLCLPTFCNAQVMARGECPDCANAAHSAAPAMPMSSGTTPAPCNHLVSSSPVIQASTPDVAIHIAQSLSAPAPAVLAAPPVRLAVLAQERPSEPPGVLLTASQLRV